MEPNNKYSAKEKLKSKKDIEMLFKKGKSINAFPIRAIYLQKNDTDNTSINAGVTVSKKNVKLAVNRNLIKRRMREAYRLNNQDLKGSELALDIMLIYTSKEILPYNLIERKIKVLLTRLTELA